MEILIMYNTTTFAPINNMEQEGLYNLFMFWYGFDKVRKNINKYKYAESKLRQQWDEVWFSKTKEIDAIISSKFSHLVDELIDYQPITIIEQIGKMILYDQVPRNIYRGTPKAYQYDHISRAIAYDLLASPIDLPLFAKVSITLTLIHSESKEDQETVLVLLADLPTPYNSGVVKTLQEIAKRHRDRVHSFGRLPERARIKQSPLSYEEQCFLNAL